MSDQNAAWAYIQRLGWEVDQEELEVQDLQKRLDEATAQNDGKRAAVARLEQDLQGVPETQDLELAVTRQRETALQTVEALHNMLTGTGKGTGHKRARG